MTATLTDIFRILKKQNEILTDQLGRSRIAVSKGGGTVINLQELTTISATLSSILSTVALDSSVDGLETLLALEGGLTIGNLLASIKGNTIDIEDRVDGLEAQGSTQITSLAAIDANTNTLEALLALEGGLTIANLLASIKANTIDIEDRVDGLEGQNSTMITNQGTMESDLESIDANWNLLSLNQLNLAAILVAVQNNATSGRQDTAQTSFDTMLTDNDAIITDLAAIEVLLGTIDTSLNNIESDADQIRISVGNLAATAIATGSSHTLNWFYDFTVGAAGAGTFTVTLTVPTGQKLTNAWASVIMPVRGSSETIEWHVLSATDVHTRRLSERTIANTSTRYHMPNEEAHANTGHIDGRSQTITVPAGQKLQWTFSTNLSNNDQVQIRCGGDLRDGTVFAAAARTGSATGNLNSEDHEEIA